MNKKVKKELLEWGIFITVIGIIYLAGWHTTLIGTLQRGILATGLIQPEEVTKPTPADYNLTLTHLEGGNVHLSEWKGKTIFLNFWATWCPPCIAELPSINKLYQDMGEEVQFALVTLDEEPGKAREFLKRKGIEAPGYHPASGMPSTYATKSIPTTFVISPEGKVAVHHLGMADYDTEDFRALLKKLSSRQ
jgi:thiol-disulfide isomerase/thioredoxin